MSRRDSILFGKTYRFNTGQYFDSLKAASGCDSIAELDLTVYPTYYHINPIQICSGQFYQIGKHSYAKSGVYIDSFKTAHFCDSIIETRLTVNSIYRDTIRRNLCQGQVYSFNNKSRTTSGLYVDSFISSFSLR
ncbi:MAG: hypothetical protein IPK03_09530 [Bacteroidetes bacterium]|nr:hypothetical protein [Bacteroidota bacterium]